MMKTEGKTLQKNKQEKKSMKKIISAILVCFILVGSMLALVSCGGGDIENGTYVATMGSYEQTVKIDGNKFIMVQTEEDENDEVIATLEIVFTYEVKADEADAEKLAALTVRAFVNAPLPKTFKPMLPLITLISPFSLRTCISTTEFASNPSNTERFTILYTLLKWLLKPRFGTLLIKGI